MTVVEARGAAQSVMAELGRIAAAVAAVYGLLTSGVIPAKQVAPAAPPERPAAAVVGPADRAKAVKEWLDGATYHAAKLAEELAKK